MSEQRTKVRKAVGLLVKLQYGDVDEFAQKYATNLSEGGMFIRSREPLPVGTHVQFKVEVANGMRVLQGEAVVRWVCEPTAPGKGPPGMGVEFLQLDAASRALVDAMMRSTAHVAKTPSPPPVAPFVVPPIAPVTAPVPPPPAVASPPPPVPPTVAPAPPRVPPVGAPPPPPPPAPSPDADLGPSIDIDVEELVSSSPPPPTPPPPTAAPAPVAGVQPLPVEVGPPPSLAPTLRPSPPPVAPRPATGGPVYLTSPDPIDEASPIIGIDLGTTNSACGVLVEGKPAVIRTRDGYFTIPSVVGLSRTGKLEVGLRARTQRLLNPSQSISEAKRLVGRDFDSAVVQQVKKRSHYDIVAGPDGRAAVRLGQDTLTLEEVQGLVLRECKVMAEQHLMRRVSRAVVTCPAYYSEPQREAVRRAGAMAGLKVERVLNEPTAAALAFGLNRGLTRTVLVYDLGGGTFDATLLRLDKNVFEVLATGGDVFLGGVDFDNQIADVLLARFEEQHGRPFGGDAVALSRISDVAERAKMALSEAQRFDVHLPMLEMDASGGSPKDLKCTLTRADVEKACEELVERTLQCVQDVLLDAKLKASQVDDVVLVGGMSRMPLVRERVAALFKKQPHAAVNPDEAVALGAALYAGTVDKVSSMVLIDVVPMTLGVGRQGGGFVRLVERNTPLPVSKSFGLSTHEDDQQLLELFVFQGEDAQVAGNEHVGVVRVEGLPKGPKGSVQVALTLQLDSECVLSVVAKELKTRAPLKATFVAPYPAAEVARRLGITAEQRDRAQAPRNAELKKRAGGFWDRVKRVLARD